MKGLLIRELHMTWFVGKSLMLFAFVFGLFVLFTEGNLFFAIYPALMFSMLPLSILATDERSRWDVYADTLPCSRSQQVSVKYLMSLIYTVSVTLFIGLCQFVQMLRTGSSDFSGLIYLLLLVASLSLLSVSLCLPFTFRFGMEKGRLMYFCVLGLFCAVIALLTAVARPLSLPKMTMPLALLIAAALFLLSWRLSIHFYRKRELH